MTTLVAWVGVDPRGIASLNMASDSRLTFTRSMPQDHVQTGYWDRARKVFACSRLPLIVGYCGNAQLAPQAIGQTIALLDSDVAFGPQSAHPSIEELFEGFRAALSSVVESYPSWWLPDVSDILIGGREGEGLGARFALRQLRIRENGSIAIPHRQPADFENVTAGDSSRYEVYGSGATELGSIFRREPKGRTSAFVFKALCSVLSEAREPSSGGAPQLVRLIRKPGTFGQIVGVRFNGEYYLYGAKLSAPIRFGSIAHWMDEGFERPKCTESQEND